MVKQGERKTHESKLHLGLSRAKHSFNADSDCPLYSTEQSHRLSACTCTQSRAPGPCETCGCRSGRTRLVRTHSGHHQRAFKPATSCFAVLVRNESCASTCAHSLPRMPTVRDLQLPVRHISAYAHTLRILATHQPDTTVLPIPVTMRTVQQPRALPRPPNRSWLRPMRQCSPAPRSHGGRELKA